MTMGDFLRGTGACPGPNFLNTFLWVGLSPYQTENSLGPGSGSSHLCGPRALVWCWWCGGGERETGQRPLHMQMMWWGKLLSSFTVLPGGPCPHSLARVPGMLTLSNLKRLSRKWPGSCSSPLPGSQ